MPRRGSAPHSLRILFLTPIAFCILLASNTLDAAGAKNEASGTSCKHPLEVVNSGRTKQISLTLKETNEPN
jgi:hypothetical protein